MAMLLVTVAAASILLLLSLYLNTVDVEQNGDLESETQDQNPEGEEAPEAEEPGGDSQGSEDGSVVDPPELPGTPIPPPLPPTP